MRTSALLFTLLAIAGCVMQAPIGRQAGSSAPGRTTPGTATLEQEVHAQVNWYRSSRGLPPLAFDERIAEVARSHSSAMASGKRPFSHVGFEDRAKAIAAFIHAPRGFAENVAYDSRSDARLAELIVQGWIRSAEHRENLEGDYDRTGVGVAVAPNGWRYFTQIYVQSGK